MEEKKWWLRENHPERKTGERKSTEPFSWDWGVTVQETGRKLAQSKHNENIPVATVALLSERGAKRVPRHCWGKCLYHCDAVECIPLRAGFGTGNKSQPVLPQVLLCALWCCWGQQVTGLTPCVVFLTCRMLGSECLQQVQGIPRREK